MKQNKLPEAPAAGLSRFHAMTEGDAEQWKLIARLDRKFARELPTALIQNLMLLRHDCHGFAVDRLEHSLQSATRAHRAGRDEEYVVCALLHDIGALMAADHHAQFAATILRPYVSDENLWMVLHHDTFQQYYYGHFFGGDRNARDKYRGHPHFQRTAEFCHQFDQTSFDPDYDTMPITAFEPMLHRVLVRPRREAGH